MILTLGTTPALQRTMTFNPLAIDEVNRATEVREYASGKSINVARIVHTLGEPVTATGFLGGSRGAEVRGDLDRVPIAHDFVEVAASTRMCITAIDRSASTATELIEEAGEVDAESGDELLFKLASLLSPQTDKLIGDCPELQFRNSGQSPICSPHWLVLSGTLAPGIDPDFYAQCVKLAHVAKVRSIVDARGEALNKAIAEKPFIVKPNRSELAATLRKAVESESDLRDAMREVISRGARWIVVTCGRDSTLLSDGKSFWKIATPSVKVISPIGSGDSFAAGLAVGLARGEDVPTACTLAVACGCANAMTSLAGHVQYQDVLDLRNQIISNGGAAPLQ